MYLSMLLNSRNCKQNGFAGNVYTIACYTKQAVTNCY